MPTIRLTDATIRTIKATEKQVEYWDQRQTGFLLRVSPGGTKTFQIFYRHQGRQRRLTLGRYPTLTLAKARVLGRNKSASAIHGDDPAGVKQADREADTFKALANDYIDQYAKKSKRSWKQDERMIDTELLPAWGSRKAIHVSRRDIRQLLDRVVSRGAPIAANRLLSLTRTIFNFGIDKEWLEANPCYRVKMPAKAKQRDRVLTGPEIKSIWSALQHETQSVCAILRLQLLTGQRIGEIRQMRLADVDLESQWWTIPETIAKNKRSHRVPLAESAVAIIKDIMKDTEGPWIFPATRDARKPFGHQTIHQAILKIRNRTGVDDWASHDLRRTVVSWLMSAGVSRTTAMKIINHVEPGVIQVYDRYGYDHEKRQALEAWSRRLAAIVAGKEQSTVVQFSRA